MSADAVITGDCARADPAADGLPGPLRGGPPLPPLMVRAELTAGTATVVISGELDIATTPLLSEYLAQILGQGPQRLLLDLAGVRFLDCAAARLVVGAGRFLPGGGRSVICRPSPAVRRVLDLTGLAAECEIVD